MQTFYLANWHAGRSGAPAPGIPIRESRMAGAAGISADWEDLDRELAAWQAAGGRATLWWRDDDAAAPAPTLDRLIELAAGLPLSLAVIPGRAASPLARRLAAPCRSLTILQHGWLHADHAPQGVKKTEFGATRPLAAMRAELAAGRRVLVALFGRLALPVLTPPWNRLAEGLMPMLPELGLTGLSTYGPRRHRAAAPGLVQVNTHIDLIDWRRRRFVGVRAALDALVRHLAARRTGRLDAAEPTGLLTHHQLLDAPGEEFLGRFVDFTRDHPGARWIDAAEAFAI